MSEPFIKIEYWCENRTLDDRSYLDGDYTVFGEVFSGMDVVMAIAQNDVIDEITIIRVGDKAKRFLADTENFRNLVSQVHKKGGESRKSEKSARSSDDPGTVADAIETDTGLKYVTVEEGR